MDTDNQDETKGSLIIGLVAAILIYAGRYITGVAFDTPEAGQLIFRAGDTDGGILNHSPALLLCFMFYMTRNNANFPRYIAWGLLIWLTLGTGGWFYMIYFQETVMALRIMGEAAGQTMEFGEMVDAASQLPPESLQKLSDAFGRGIWHQVLLVAGVTAYWFSFLAVREVQFANQHAAQTEREVKED